MEKVYPRPGFRWGALCSSGMVVAFVIFNLVFNIAAHSASLDWLYADANEPEIADGSGVSYVNDICFSPLANNKMLPVKIVFNPAKYPFSGIIGYGWRVPVLEAFAVLESPNDLRVVLPDGRHTSFRVREDGSIDDSQGWAAKMTQTSLELKSNSGDEVRYSNGKLSGYSRGPNIFSVQWSNGVPVSLVCDGAELLHVNYKSGLAHEIIADGKSIILTYANVPITQTIQGISVIKSLAPSLGGISTKTAKKTFEYKTAPSMLLVASVNEPAGERIIWNEKRETEAPPAHLNDLPSDYMIRSLLENGGERLEYIFSSGALTGRTRKIDIVNSGKKTTVYRAVFGEQGQLLRDYLKDGLIRTIAGGAISISKDGKEVSNVKLIDDKIAITDQ